MISTTQLIREYRHLRQHSPRYDAHARCWQVADYNSVRVLLAQMAPETDTGTRPVDAIAAQRITDYLSGYSFRSACDLIQDVLEPLSRAILTASAQTMLPQVRPHLAEILTGHITVEPLQFLPEPPNSPTNTALREIIQHELFITLAGNALYTLLMQPAQLALLQAHPEYTGRAVQEVLRLAPPVHRLRGIAPVDIPLARNVVITAGQSVEVIAIAASRDPLMYRNADVFDMRRRVSRPVPVLHINWIPSEAVVIFLQYLLPVMRRMRLRFGEMSWQVLNGWYRLQSMPVTVR